VLVIAAAAIGFVFIPFLATYVIDLSSAWTHKRHLQLQADAAALAAGDNFAACPPFSSTPNPNSVIQDAASDYSGGDTEENPTTGYTHSGSLHNAPGGQFGSNNGTTHVLYNNQTYFNGAPDLDPPAGGWGTAQPCQIRLLDVKVTESDLPLFFGIPGLKLVPAINAHARVGLFNTQIGQGGLPLAVPDTNPSNVFVTLWNMTTNQKIGDYDLAGPTPSGSPNFLNMWSGPVTLNMPNVPSDIGMRVGVGNVGAAGGGSCFHSAGVSGQYQCYDQTTTNPDTPLVLLRGNSTAAGSFTAPVLHSVTEISCSGSPFFSDINNSPCSTTVTANIDWGSCGAGLTCIEKVTATDPNGTQTLMAPNCGSGCYQFNYTYPLADGAEPVTLSWTLSTTGASCGHAKQPSCPAGSGTFAPTPDQQAYSADADLDVTGPVKVVSISPGYSFAQGSSQPLTVTVGLVGNLTALELPRPAGSVDVLRLFTSGTNRSAIVGCDGANDADVENAFQNGCQTPYQIYGPPAGPCPDPSNPSPADCVPVKQGNLGQTIKNALDQRYQSCPPVNYPGYVEGDPRIVQVMVTDTSALLAASGGGLVPVTNFAEFLITGWARFTGNSWKTSCPGVNDPVPASLGSRRGAVAIWGHFIQYVNPSNDPGPVPVVCPPSPGITPCTPLLTK
jgi:hypothetical protein